MMKLLVWTGATVGSALGWWALSHFGMFASFMGSIVGTAVGIYVGRKIAKNYGA